MKQRSIIKLYKATIEIIEKVKDLPPLLIRLVLVYGFYSTASMKWQNISGVAEWFGSIGIPLPTLNAYLAASTEAAGVILLTIGLATRLISIPLIITMIVAIVTVHLNNGFESGNNGFEIPLYYLIMLLTLLIWGPGRISLDKFFWKKLTNESN